MNRPKDLCVDYLQLKDAFGLDLETEMVTDMSEALENEERISDTAKKDLV